MATGQSASPVPSSEPNRLSASEQEYGHLVSFFKYLVTITVLAITLILAAGGVVFYKNMADVKSDAKAAIDGTKDAAGREIAKIQDDAARIARSEAQKRVDDAFAKSNVQAMIEQTARERVNRAVDKEIERNLRARIEPLQEQISETGEISNAGARLRLGFRPALDTLVEKTKSANKHVSEYAKSTLLLIGSDYEKVQTGVTTPLPKTIPHLMEVIRHSENVYDVAAAFFGFREMTGTKIQAFDIPAAEQWCAEHRPKCE